MIKQSYIDIKGLLKEYSEQGFALILIKPDPAVNSPHKQGVQMEIVGRRSSTAIQPRYHHRFYCLC